MQLNCARKPRASCQPQPRPNGAASSAAGRHANDARRDKSRCGRRLAFTSPKLAKAREWLVSGIGIAAQPLKATGGEAYEIIVACAAPALNAMACSDGCAESEAMIRRRPASHAQNHGHRRRLNGDSAAASCLTLSVIETRKEAAAMQSRNRHPRRKCGQ